MHSLAQLIAFFARLLSLLIRGVVGGDGAVTDWRMADPLANEPAGWEKVAAWLGWIPLRARRVPAYVRRVQADWPQHPDHR